MVRVRQRAVNARMPRWDACRKREGIANDAEQVTGPPIPKPRGNFDRVSSPGELLTSPALGMRHVAN